MMSDTIVEAIFTCESADEICIKVALHTGFDVIEHMLPTGIVQEVIEKIENEYKFTFLHWWKHDKVKYPKKLLLDKILFIESLLWDTSIFVNYDKMALVDFIQKLKAYADR